MKTPIKITADDKYAKEFFRKLHEIQSIATDEQSNSMILLHSNIRSILEVEPLAIIPEEQWIGLRKKMGLSQKVIRNKWHETARELFLIELFGAFYITFSCIAMLFYVILIHLLQLQPDVFIYYGLIFLLSWYLYQKLWGVWFEKLPKLISLLPKMSKVDTCLAEYFSDPGTTSPKREHHYTENQDFLITITRQRLVAIVAQHGDFPITKEYINEIVESSKLLRIVK